MIAPLTDKGLGMQASFVAKDFALKTVPDRAILNITAQGFAGLSPKARGWATRRPWCPGAVIGRCDHWDAVAVVPAVQ